MTASFNPDSSDKPADAPGFLSGPDPESPPWSGQDDEGDEDESRDVRDDDAGWDDDEDDEPPTGGALAEVVRDLAMPRPPKRTGVLLDPDDLRTYVGDLLRVMLGGYQVDAYGNYTFTHEGARVFVTTGMSPVGPTVGVFSITNLDVDLTPDLAAFLLHTNHRLGFGAFSYDVENKAVWLAHTLLGTVLDGPELQAAVMAIASTAAQVDDPIRDKFGGRAFHDAPEDVQQRAKPPEASGDPAHPNTTGYL